MFSVHLGSTMKSNTLSKRPSLYIASVSPNSSLKVRQKSSCSENLGRDRGDYRQIVRDFGIIHSGLNAGRRQSPTEICYKLLLSKCCKRCLAHHTYHLVCQEILAQLL
jgi:hypothetical protein